MVFMVIAVALTGEVEIRIAAAFVRSGSGV